MRNIMIAALALALSMAAGPAAAASQTFTVTDFDRVEVSGPYKVTLAVGKSSSAKASGSRDAIDRILIDVQGRTLRIRTNRSTASNPLAQVQGSADVMLTTGVLTRATVNGSGALLIDKARAMRLDLVVAGSGSMEVGQIEADVLSLNLIGSGQMRVGGKAKTLRAEIHGSGSLDATALSADDAVVVADSAGPVKLAAVRSAKITATASGDVEVIGSPACTTTVRGSGSVRCGR